MAEIILHHYPQSPVSEKVRVVLGMKGLDWRSVIIPRLPPKPDLMPLTGGYRMTPVMQVGADIHCDSQCILRALDRLHPRPALFPGGARGLAWGLGRWTDGALFQAVIALVFGDAANDMPTEFAADRIPLYFGPDVRIDDLKDRLAETLAETLAQVGAQLQWMDDRLAGGRAFMLGDAPGLPDALCYYLVWFVRGRYSKGPELLARFEALTAWERRVQALGHGRPRDMTAGEALDLARDAAPQPPAPSAADDPQGLAPGDKVEISPLGVGSAPPPGGQAVTGRITGVNVQEIVINREHERVGQVAVHFPRVGYRVRKV